MLPQLLQGGKRTLSKKPNPEQQFAQSLQPPSPTGATSQDAILALLDAPSQGVVNSSTNTGYGSTSTSSTPAVAGTTALSALQALIGQGSASNTATGIGAFGNTAQDDLLALFGSNRTDLTAWRADQGAFHDVRGPLFIQK